MLRANVKVGIRSERMVRQNGLSQRKISMYGAYRERFWIRPIHFFVRSTNPTLRWHNALHQEGNAYVQKSPFICRLHQVCAARKKNLARFPFL